MQENKPSIIIESSDENFISDVIDASKDVPIIVDFWAPWCGPCKTLGPALESVVKNFKGQVRLVKIDIDQNPNFAGQLRVQSIPAVFAFFDGKPIDGFMGVQTPSQLKEFVEKLIVKSGGSIEKNFDNALSQANDMLESGDFLESSQIFQNIIQEDNLFIEGHLGFINAQILLNNFKTANTHLDNIPAEISKEPQILALKAKIDLAEKVTNTGSSDDLKIKSLNNPNDNQTKFDFALALVSEGKHDKAIDILLELHKKDSNWNNGASRLQLIQIFDSLGPKDLLSQKGRRQLSSLIFS